MTGLVSLVADSDIGIIKVTNPPVNALSPGVLEGMVAAIGKAANDPAFKGVVLVGGGKTFIAGADIREFQKMTVGAKPRRVGLHPLLYALEDCPKPVVCAIHGTAFGGGLEVAMACHYRVAVASAQLGQPEVKLGLIPGAGGTQRLPRLAGVAKAVEMCTTGVPVTAAVALESGIVDRIVEGSWRPGPSSSPARWAAGQAARKTRLLDARLGNAVQETPLSAAARELVRNRDRGQLAPLKAIDAIEAATKLDFEAGCVLEAELFMECLFSEQSKALIHVFFGEREVSKIPELPRDTPVADVRLAAVVGAGTMGSGIAMVYANAGIPVLLKEASREALDRGLDTIRKNYAASVSAGRIPQETAERRLALIRPQIGYDGFDAGDLVVEAVFESMELKRQIFAELDSVCGPEAILATNTSSLDIDQIAAATSRPERVIGHHFFAPPNVMQLLEVVRGKASSPRTIASSMALAKRLGKTAVLVGNCRGFVGNRMYHQYQREAQFLVEEGATVQQVDAALYNFGMAMGPLATSDLSGLDVSWRIRKEHGRLEPVGARQALISDRLCEMGRFGQKTGAGWYRYTPGSRKAIADPEVDRIIAQCVREAGISQREIPPGEIIERTIYALINEGAWVLEEGIALRAVDIDIVYVHGCGFPAHRGGPMWYADTVGLDQVYSRVRDFQERFGDHWVPAPLLARLAREGGTFAGLVGGG